MSLRDDHTLNRYKKERQAISVVRGWIVLRGTGTSAAVSLVIGGLLLFVKRRVFTKLDRGVQLSWGFLAWGIHIAVFVAVLAGL